MDDTSPKHNSFSDIQSHIPFLIQGVRVYLVMLLVAWVCSFVAGLLGVFPDGTFFGGLGLALHLPLCVNSVACYIWSVPEQEEFLRCLRMARMSCRALGIGMALWGGTSDHVQYFTLGLLSSAFSIKPAMLSMCRDEVTVRKSCVTWILDEISMVALAARLHMSGSVNGHLGMILPIFVFSASQRGIVEVMSFDSARLRFELSDELDKSQRACSMLEIARAALNQHQNAMDRMLSALCDCRLKLSDSMCMVDVAPQIHDMLGCRGSLQNLFGSSLERFLSKQDAERLRLSLSRDTDEKTKRSRGPAACLQVELLHQSGKPLPVELYHTRFSNSEHAVAIRQKKVEDFEATAAAAEPGAEADGSAEIDDDSAAEMAWVDIDAADPNLRVCDSSEEFQGHENVGLLDWIRSSRRGRVSHWVSSTYAAVESADGEHEIQVSKLLYFELNLSLATVVAKKAWLECFPAGSGRGGAEKPVRLWLESLSARWKPVQEDPHQDFRRDRAETVSEIGIEDSFSQVGHLFFVSNRS